MKLKDGSESLRMKAEMAKRVRAEAERLELSFLETLYFICVSYFSEQEKQTKKAGSTPTKPELSQPKIKQTEVESNDDDDAYVFDMLD